MYLNKVSSHWPSCSLTALFVGAAQFPKLCQEGMLFVLTLPPASCFLPLPSPKEVWWTHQIHIKKMLTLLIRYSLPTPLHKNNCCWNTFLFFLEVKRSVVNYRDVKCQCNKNMLTQILFNATHFFDTRLMHTHSMIMIPQFVKSGNDWKLWEAGRKFSSTALTDVQTVHCITEPLSSDWKPRVKPELISNPASEYRPLSLLWIVAVIINTLCISPFSCW